MFLFYAHFGELLLKFVPPLGTLHLYKRLFSCYNEEKATEKGDFSMAILGNEDHKQRINLSSLAWSVMEMDKSMFDPEGSLSGFLNRIITAFRDKAEASVDTMVAERRQQLLAGGYPPAITQRLAQEYRDQLLAKQEAYPQGDSLIFRLNNRNFDTLYEQRAESTAYAAPSKYLKALLEEYARLSPSERERVYYSTVIEEVLQPAIDAGNPLDVAQGNRRFWVKPHSVMADPFNSHLYLVGLARRVDKPSDKEVIASFRITRLAEIKQRRQPSGRLTIDDKRQIEKRIQQVGVQYLIGAQDNIAVRLTPTGRQNFLQRSYMRPTPRKVEGDVYHFTCSPIQIRNYFLTFGKDAEVLEPAFLREEFANAYREAARLYE